MVKTVGRQLGSVSVWALKQLLSTPVSLVLLVILWGCHVANALLPQWDMMDTLGLRMPYAISDPRILVCGLTTLGVGSAAIATVGILLLAVPAERILGSRLFALCALLVHLVATPIGLMIARAVEETGLHWWGGDFLNMVLLSPAGWIFGSVAIASARMPLLWRRRVRTLLGALSITMVLFSGTLSDGVALVALFGGVLAGAVLAPERPGEARVASRREARKLLSLVFFCTALGPVLAAFNPLAEGAFSGVIQLIWGPEISLETMYSLCREDSASQDCTDAVLHAAQTGVGSFLLNLIPLLVYGVLALGLMKGRRLAWQLAVLAQLVTIAVIGLQLWTITDLDEPDVPLLVINGLMMTLPWIVSLVFLVARRSLFRVPLRHDALLRAAGGALVAALLSALLWVLGGLVLSSHFHPHATIPLLLGDLPAVYLPPVLGELYNYTLVPHTSSGWMLNNWTGILFWAILLVVLYRALMSVPNPEEEAHRAMAREIIRQGTGDHLSWMTLWEGNRYWFAPPRDEGGQPSGYVAYRVDRGIAVTVGEPVLGAGEDDPQRIALLFEDYATNNGWRTAWYSVRSEFARDCGRRGFRAVHVAEESTLDCHHLEFRGKKFQNIRTARNRAVKEGISTIWAPWQDLDPRVKESIIALSEHWVADKTLPEMGFTLGGISELKEPGTRILVAVDEDLRVHGVTSWLPVYEGGELAGYTLDFMRRDATGFRPVIEYLLAEGAQRAQDEGLGWVSLSGAPLSRTDSAEEPGILDAILEKLGRTMEPLYGFRSLAASKYKFHPEHHQWFLCYADELALPAIGLAVTHCYVPDMKMSDALKAARAWGESMGDHGEKKESLPGPRG
ncbi:DUF2156 domain-containing protein [Corynebacterium uropygiale]|uniref:DUF2156 domain-containing protein n=1 Tax=Corynebacterium uropygiale TaxID=1775911 RepID=A0A9X1TY74_9CORY|nr:DUF2156 domain-containing protein [Corynebacterium uropygiale]MCF4006980.1 DUF2156 domain-containing protein [Corynebacterium uropygiale]